MGSKRGTINVSLLLYHWYWKKGTILGQYWSDIGTILNTKLVRIWYYYDSNMVLYNILARLISLNQDSLTYLNHDQDAEP